MAVKESPKESLKALIVNTSDTEGGAARAAFRLHQGLHQRRLSGSGATKVDAQMLVQAKQSDDRNVLGTSAASGLGRAATGLKLTLDQLPLKRYPQHDGTKFSSQWIPDRVTRTVKQINPDVINLHWINNGYLKIETLARWQKPIVWTLHDMWPFTGGCHYDQNCDRYTQSCGACPQLGSSNNRDLSSRIWNRKQKTFQKAFHTQPLTVVAPSQWLADCARKSTLFQDYRVECIPNGINTTVYRPFNKRFAREALKLPQDKQLILFGSLRATSDNRKGFHFLQSALQKLSTQPHSATGEKPLRDTVELVVFGASTPETVPDFGFKTHYLGSFSDDLSLSLVYSAADMFILPSIQENLANTILEAMACGLPCAAFNIGGMPDMICHKETGYLATPYETDDLAKGIDYILTQTATSNKLSDQAVRRVSEHFSLELQAHRYADLFEQVSDFSQSNQQHNQLTNRRRNYPQKHPIAHEN